MTKIVDISLIIIKFNYLRRQIKNALGIVMIIEIILFKKAESKLYINKAKIKRILKLIIISKTSFYLYI